MEHIAIAAAIYNCYFCLNAQGRFKHTTIPRQLFQALPQIREAADYMMKRKVALVSIAAVKELAEGLTEFVASQ
jgi:hypothetical protein